MGLWPVRNSTLLFVDQRVGTFCVHKLYHADRDHCFLAAQYWSGDNQQGASLGQGGSVQGTDQWSIGGTVLGSVMHAGDGFWAESERYGTAK